MHSIYIGFSFFHWSTYRNLWTCLEMKKSTRSSTFPNSRAMSISFCDTETTQFCCNFQIICIPVSPKHASNAMKTTAYEGDCKSPSSMPADCKSAGTGYPFCIIFSNRLYQSSPNFLTIGPLRNFQSGKLSCSPLRLAGTQTLHSW